MYKEYEIGKKREKLRKERVQVVKNCERNWKQEHEELHCRDTGKANQKGRSGSRTLQNDMSYAQNAS